jgi:hypothetical protein
MRPSTIRARHFGHGFPLTSSTVACDGSMMRQPVLFALPPLFNIAHCPRSGRASRSAVPHRRNASPGSQDRWVKGFFHR